MRQEVWQRLPYRVRRGAVFEVVRWVAPRPSVHVRPISPLHVFGHVSEHSGLGTAARLCATALQSERSSVTALPTDISGSFGRVRHQPVRGPGTLLAHINAPFMPLALARLGRPSLAGKYVVGCWAWELPGVPDDWKSGFEYVHEIWVPSQFTADAVKQIAGAKPVRVVPYPVAVDFPVSASHKSRPTQQPQRQEPTRPFEVLTLFNMASSFARKNPLASVQAFKRAFGTSRSAHLTLKVSNGSVFPNGLAQLSAAIEGLNATIVTDIMDQKTDILMSLHRSEGFGLSIAEAMLLGIPTIATNWSGNTDFLNVQTGCPISYRLIAAEDPQHTYDYPALKWADPDTDEAAETLTRLFNDPSRRLDLGLAAQNHARGAFSASTYNAHVTSLLDRAQVGGDRL
jgi:glycosyltransferase involved in cell wall biosynthesis